jgi:hypothetical protein
LIGKQYGFNFEPYPLTFRENTGTTVGFAMFEELERCIAEDASLLFVPPDTIFGDGTIPNLISLGDFPRVCVSVGSVRVLPQILDAVSVPLENAQLVRLAWEHLHSTWVEAEMGREIVNSWRGGVAWKKLGEGMYAVQHRLPSPWLVNPMPSDVSWLRAKGSIGAWDHEWPAKLVNEGRQRLVGSSDIAFMVEITPAEESNCPTAPANPEEPDSFHLDNSHNHVNRNTVALYRAGN